MPCHRQQPSPVRIIVITACHVVVLCYAMSYHMYVISLNVMYQWCFCDDVIYECMWVCVWFPCTHAALHVWMSLSAHVHVHVALGCSLMDCNHSIHSTWKFKQDSNTKTNTTEKKCVRSTAHGHAQQPENTSHQRTRHITYHKSHVHTTLHAQHTTYRRDNVKAYNKTGHKHRSAQAHALWICVFLCLYVFHVRHLSFMHAHVDVCVHMPIQSHVLIAVFIRRCCWYVLIRLCDDMRVCFQCGVISCCVSVPVSASLSLCHSIRVSTILIGIYLLLQIIACALQGHRGAPYWIGIKHTLNA